MTKIKNCIRGTGDPVTQIANRLAEMTACQSRAQKAQKLSLAKVKAKNLCEVFGKTEPYFVKPCDSQIVGIQKARRQNSRHVKSR